MANKIQVKRSAVPTKVPTTTDLALGEIAVNTFDGKMYIKKDNGTASVIEIGGTSGSGTVTSVDVSGGSTGLTTSGGPVTTSGTITLGGTLAVGYGGTGQTSYTNGQLLIGNSTGNTLTKSTLTAGSGISITNGSGSITISSTGSMVYPGAGIPNSTGTAWGTSYGITGANSVVVRDANQNIAVNSVDDSYVNQAAGTAITLTTASARRYTITGSGGQTIKLPDATTLSSGAIFQFDNNQTSGAITVNNNSNTLIASIPSGGYVLVNLLSNATAAGSWDRHDQAPSNVSWSTNTFDYAGSITSATWNGVAIAINRGGTGASTASTAFNNLSPLTTAGDMLYGGTSGAGTRLAIGTAGQVLTVNSGATAPQWSTPTTGTVTSVTGTAPIASTGGATPAISISQSTTSTNGYLSSTDWNTFNGKQTAYTNLSTIGTLANATGWLYNNGSGTFSYSTPTKTDVGLSNVTNDTQTKAAIVPNTAPTAGQVLVGNSGGTAYAPVSISGDATLASTGAATLATVNSNVGSFTNASVTVNGKGLVTAVSNGTAPVTSVSVTSANGFAGTSSGGATPALTLTTSITGVLKGNGTAISAATSGTDYSAGTSTLTTGILKSTTTTGALTIAVAADFPTLNQNTSGSAATLTTPRAIYGNNFDGSAALTQVIASTYGGTGNGFTKFSGATTAEKTYTLPDATTTILTTNAAVTVGQGGTGQTTYTNGQLLIGNTTGNTLTKATLTAGSGISITNGAGAITIGSSTVSLVYDSFTATAGQTSFTTSASYTSGQIQVFRNGALMRNGTDVTVTSGNAVVFASGLTVGDIVDVTYPTTATSSLMQYDQFTATASQTTFTTSKTYNSNKIQVFAQGVLMRNGTDVTVSNGTTVVFATGLAVGTLVDVSYPPA